ncbi:hypothetical protein MPER_11422 [Moniliophthora perniciosa FA553]|nr:hypothetical protein MPER_11422 [Moniliophthora perniciosa FA553]
MTICFGFTNIPSAGTPPMKSHTSHATSGSVISADNYGFPEEDLRQEGKDNPGYFPVRLGQPLEDGRFCIVRKPGWGQNASVWLAKDRDRNIWHRTAIM